MIKGEEVGDLEEDLVQVERVTSLIRELQATLELFDRGKKREALEKISDLEGDIEELAGSGLAQDSEVKERLALVLKHLEWVEENEDRSSGRS